MAGRSVGGPEPAPTIVDLTAPLALHWLASLLVRRCPSVRPTTKLPPVVVAEENSTSDRNWVAVASSRIRRRRRTTIRRELSSSALIGKVSTTGAADSRSWVILHVGTLCQQGRKAALHLLLLTLEIDYVVITAIVNRIAFTVSLCASKHNRYPYCWRKSVNVNGILHHKPSWLITQSPPPI